MLVDFKDISSQVTHHGAKGRIRERRIAVDYLEKYLPGRIGIGNGEIVCTDGRVSPEIDIALYDKFSTPYLLKEECYQVFPVECVYGVMEVKSYLSQRELTDIAENFRIIKSLPKVALEPQAGPIVHQTTLYGREFSYFPIVGLVMAYDSIELAGLADCLNTTQAALPPEYRIDSVWVLNRGMIVPVNIETKKVEFTPGPMTMFAPMESENPLLLLTLHLQTLMNGAWMSPFRLRDYLEKAIYGKVNYTSPAGTLSSEMVQRLLSGSNAPMP